jgi:hypothetical protein
MIVYGLIMPFWFGWPTTVQVVGMTVMTVAIGSLFAYLGMLIVGLPANFLLSLLRAERGVTYLTVGAVSLPVLLAFNDPSTPTIGQFTLAAAPGSLVAGLWWLIASRN